MSFCQFRVALGIAAGVIGASLLGATFVGCQSNQPNGPYGQYNRGPNGPQMTGMPPGDLNSLAPQNRQAFLNETQRVGAEQGLSMQDLVAMKRSGLSDQQIAMAVQQRGGGLAASPGAAQYLAQNGVNPAVLNAAGSPASMSPGMMSGMPGGMPAGMTPAMNAGMNNAMQPGMQPGMSGGASPGMMPPMGGGSPIGMPVNQYTASGGSPPFQPMNTSGSAPVTTALNSSSSPPTSPMTPEQGAPIQPTGYEAAQPGFESAAPTATGSAVPGQMWRPMGH